MPTLVRCSGGGGGSDTDAGTESGEGTDSDTGFDDDLPNYDFDGDPGPEGLFSHGVASGDPLSDSVILWTRVSPDPDSGDSIEVFYEVALDPEFNDRVAAGYVMTDAERDFTVKLDTEGMSPGTTYYYRFMALGRTSPVGRTRTAPEGEWARIRLAVASCSNYAFGYFHAYGAIAKRAELDAVLHLGDYIYEYADGTYGGLRPQDPSYEIVTLSDYRRRYACYRGDPDLQEVHRQHPFINVWDDHESANDAYKGGAENHTEGEEGSWSQRKADAERAYNEWLPTREGAPGIIYRAFAFGDLVDLIMLDTRLVGRDEQSNDVADHADPERSLLGAEQEAWLEEQLVSSTAKWRVIGQQVMMAHQMGPAGILSTDQWDGYAAARSRFLDVLEDNGVDNVVVLTGDIHSSWACDITRDPETYDPGTGAGSVLVEMITPSITSPGLAGAEDFVDLVLTLNPHIRWVDVRNGFLVLDITPERALGEWYHVQSVSSQGATGASFTQAYSVQSGARTLQPEDGPAPPVADPPPLAP